MFQKLVSQRNKKGFTLVELIVVIAILGIIAALAIPQFNNLKKQSAEQIAAANARSVYTAGMAWKALNDNQTTGEIGKDELKDLLGDKFTNNEGTYTFDVEEESATWEGTIKGYEVEGTYSSDESEDKD